MAGKMGHFQYHSDDGNVYRLKMDASNAALMGGAASTTDGPKPGGLEPRYILAEHPTTGRERKVLAPDPTSALWVGGTKVISLTDYDVTPPAAVDYSIRGRVGEKRYAR